MPQTSFDTRLINREFGSYLLSVVELAAWAKTKSFQLPSFLLIDAPAFVQVEYLICAMGSFTEDLSEEEALQIVQIDPALRSDPAALIAPKWLISAEASKNWRARLTESIKTGELALLDFGSRLPIKPTASVLVHIKGKASELKWTPEYISEVRAYRDRHTVKDTSTHFGVSASLIRRKIKTVKAQANAFTSHVHRLK
jgi:hypothetical protein